MDTRINIFLLIDYKEYYDEDKKIEDALNLLRGIPSITLINYISGFSVNLYLQENSEHSGKIQRHLINNLVVKAGSEVIEKCQTVLLKQINKGHSPVIFWSYSNLLFYGLIFKVYNTLPSRDLTAGEAKKVLDAYLIINQHCNNKIQIGETEILKAEIDNKIEEIVMPNFIYQKDYASTTDFSNQVTRGAMFFEFLERHHTYSPLVKEYYSSLNISGWLRMFKNLMTLFTEMKIDRKDEARIQLANLYGYNNKVDLPYINTLCINSAITNYEEDKKFSLLRSKILFKLNSFQFFILNPNFLIDQFYKAQVFAFNSFLKQKGITNEFLSIKGKEFMEDIYLKKIFNYAFSKYEKHFGDTALNSKNEELCDVYLRKKNKIAVIEFKDVLLNDEIKNSTNKERLFDEFDIKFLKNQKKKQKGVTQLLNVVNEIETNSISFDKSLPPGTLEIFPIIVYTDLSFGVEGLNKIFKEKFEKENENKEFVNINLNSLTFINLNFFEIWEDYLETGLMDIFILLEEYNKHILNPKYNLTPFEVFTRFYMNKNIPQELGTTKQFKELTARIIKA
jgi:hypothetical protein